MQVELRNISIAGPFCILPVNLSDCVPRLTTDETTYRPIDLSVHNSCLAGAAPCCSDDLVQGNGIIVGAILLLSCTTRHGLL